MDERAGCWQFDIELPAYLEGEDKPGLLAHARECPFCKAVLVDLEQIRLAGHEMVLDEPPSRVWANIRAQLAQEGLIREQANSGGHWFQHFGFFPSPAPIAALGTLAIFGALLLIHSRSFEGSLTASRAQAPVVEATTAGSVDDARLTLMLAEMEKSYQASMKALDPAVKVVYQKSLESLDTSIDECRASVRREPANDLAHEYLLTAYAQKAQVLASALEFEGR